MAGIGSPIGSPLGSTYASTTTKQPTNRKDPSLYGRPAQPPGYRGVQPTDPANYGRPGQPPSTLTPASPSLAPTTDPATQLANQLSSGYNRGIDFFSTIAQPKLDQLSLLQESTRSNIGLIQADTALNTRFATDQHATSLARLALQEQALGLDAAANRRAIGMFDELLALSDEDFTRTSATLNTFESLINEQLALQLQGLGLDEQQAQLGSDIATRNLLSDATARGAVSAPGTSQGFKDIQGQLAIQLQGIGLSKKEAERASKEALTNLSERKGQLSTDYKRDTLSLEEQRAKALDADKQLGLRAKDFGLQKDQLRTALEQGLANLKLGNAIKVNDLMSALVSGDFEKQQIAEGIIREAINASGYFSSLPNAPTSAGLPSLGANGRIPLSSLTPIGGGHYLHPTVASAWNQMVAAAAADGVQLVPTDSYRDLATQQRLAKEKGLYSQGGLAAEPGHSNHGLGIALDIDVDNPRVAQWLQVNGPRFGFKTIPREPWHWEWAGGDGHSHGPKAGGERAQSGAKPKPKPRPNTKGNKGRSQRV